MIPSIVRIYVMCLAMLIVCVVEGRSKVGNMETRSHSLSMLSVADEALIKTTLTEDSSTICNGQSCSDCVRNSNCGFCQSTQISGDGTASRISSECREGDQNGPSDTSHTCDSWSYLTCSETCPNGCSGQGVCDTDGVCTCLPGYEGSDCSTEQETHNKAEILIPIAFLCALFVVSLLVFEHVRDQRCMRDGNRSDDEDPELEPATWEEGGQEGTYGPSVNDPTKAPLLRARPARG